MWSYEKNDLHIINVSHDTHCKSITAQCISKSKMPDTNVGASSYVSIAKWLTYPKKKGQMTMTRGISVQLTWPCRGSRTRWRHLLNQLHFTVTSGLDPPFSLPSMEGTGIHSSPSQISVETDVLVRYQITRKLNFEQKFTHLLLFYTN